MMQGDPIDNPDDNDPEENLAKEQAERGYYYDDAHGYEKFDPDIDDDDEDDDEKCARTNSD